MPCYLTAVWYATYVIWCCNIKSLCSHFIKSADGTPCLSDIRRWCSWCRRLVRKDDFLEGEGEWSALTSGICIASTVRLPVVKLPILCFGESEMTSRSCDEDWLPATRHSVHAEIQYECLLFEGHVLIGLQLSSLSVKPFV